MEEKQGNARFFIECEKIFRARTSTFQTSINSSTDYKLQLLCYGVGPKVPDEICFNIFEEMLVLFTRTFSYAKDIREI